MILDMPLMMGKPRQPRPEKNCLIVASHFEAGTGWKLTDPTKDFQIEMSSRDTLVTLVEAVLKEAFQRNENEDEENASDAPGWAMTFEKQPYKYQGWVPPRERNIAFEFRDELVNARTGKAPALVDMVWKFKSGLHSSVVSEAGSFEFRLQTLRAVKATDTSPVPFAIQAVSPSFSGKLERDYLGLATILKADRNRAANDAYYQRKNAWRRKEDDGEYEACLADRPTWTAQDIELLALLYMGTGPKKFHKTWLAISRFGLLHHKQGDAINYWKRIECSEYAGITERIEETYRTKKEMIVAAKQLALQLLEACLKRGVPEPQLKPEKRQRIE